MEFELLRRKKSHST